MQELYDSLLADLRLIGVDPKFSLVLKPYSSTKFGIFNPNNSKVTLYVYDSKECTRLYPYEELLLTLVHEAVHSIQWNDKNFRRVKGVMHNVEFKQICAHYSDRARALLLLREVIYEKSNIKHKKAMVHQNVS